MTNSFFRFFLDFFLVQSIQNKWLRMVSMSDLKNISLLYMENKKEIQDKLRLYLDNSFRELFGVDNELFGIGDSSSEYYDAKAIVSNQEHKDRIELMVSDIDRLFNKIDSLIEEQNYIYRFNQNLLYNFSSRHIMDGDKIVKLNNQEITLLEYLIKNRGTTMSYEILMYIISNSLNNSSSIETLRTVVKRLRAKMDNSIILTISKVGYRLSTPQIEPLDLKRVEK